MQTITTIGLDIAKSVFQVHGIDAEGKVVLRRQLKRRYVVAFFQRLPPCLVGIEACAPAETKSLCTTAKAWNRRPENPTACRKKNIGGSLARPARETAFLISRKYLLVLYGFAPHAVSLGDIFTVLWYLWREEPPWQQPMNTGNLQMNVFGGPLRLKRKTTESLP